MPTAPHRCSKPHSCRADLLLVLFRTLFTLSLPLYLLCWSVPCNHAFIVLLLVSPFNVPPSSTSLLGTTAGATVGSLR